MSSYLLQTMKNFEPLKFPALIKCISLGDKKIHEEGNADKWHLVIGVTLIKESGNIFLPKMIPIPL